MRFKGIRLKGFTLIELLVTLAIASVVMGLAVPSFSLAIKNNRLTSQINEFTSSLYYARSEAIKRGTRVTLCKSSNGTTCVTDGLATDWSQGWIVFTDQNNTATFDPLVGETLLKVYGSAPQEITMVGNTNFRNYISYVAEGYFRNIAGNTVNGRIEFCDDRRGENIGKDIVLQTGGRFRVDSNELCPW